MAGPDAMRDLVMRAYAARDAGRADDLMSAFHADAVFHLAGNKDVVAMAGAIEGHDSVGKAMRGFVDAFTFQNRDIRSMTIEGDRAAVHSRIEVTFVRSGFSSTTDVLDLFRFRDGKIVELIEFADTALINKMLSGVTS